MIFLNSASFAGALVFYLPFSGPSPVYTPRNTEIGQSPECIFLKRERGRKRVREKEIDR